MITGFVALSWLAGAATVAVVTAAASYLGAGQVIDDPNVGAFVMQQEALTEEIDSLLGAPDRVATPPKLTTGERIERARSRGASWRQIAEETGMNRHALVRAHAQHVALTAEIERERRAQRAFQQVIADSSGMYA